MSKFPSQARFHCNQAALRSRPGRWRVERQGVSCRNETRRLVRKDAACFPSVSSWKTGVMDQAKGRDVCEREYRRVENMSANQDVVTRRN